MPLREIPGRAGRLEVLLDGPAEVGGVGADGLVHRGETDGVRAAVVLAHPHPQYGGTFHTKALYQSAKALARISCVVLRFNFRGVGRSEGSFSGGPGEVDDCRAALDFMHERYPGAKLWAGGMSFGAWVGMITGEEDSRVSTLIGIAPPLSRYDFGPVRVSSKAKFFIQPERDELCPLKQMREFYAQAAEPKELVVIDGADHLFDGKVSELADAIEELFGDWDG